MDTAMPQDQFAAMNIDPALAEMVEAAPQDQVLEGIMRLEDPASTPPEFVIISKFNRICTGRFRAADAWNVRKHPNVISLKAARPLGLHEGDDRAPFWPWPPEGPSRSMQPRFTGRGCIVAALDFGLDFGHPNFRNPDGTTRVIAFWDQGADYDSAHPNKFGYGRMYSRDEINAALRTPDPYRTLGSHPAASDSGLGTHGTHTLDIAAGNGRAPGSTPSAAPDADIVFVHLSTPSLDVAGDLGDSVRLLEALDYVDQTANGRPWVVNLSVGRTAGSHDGTSLVEQGMHELLRLGPSRAIVQSAGNYRSANLAVEGWLRDGEHRDLDWKVDPADTTANEMDAWYSGKDRFCVAIRAPGERDFTEVKLGEVADLTFRGSTIGRIYHRKDDPNNHDNHIEVFLHKGAPAGTWTVRLIGEYVISGRFHAWIERDLARRGAQSRFDNKITTRRYTLGTIATSPLTITVGAYDAASDDRAPAHFSSMGPTRDERVDKPELLAPGVKVLAARSIPRNAARQEGLLIARSGTSMAAPHVTGVVAAMLEAAGRPVSVDVIRDCLKRSCAPPRSDKYSNQCAWGWLDSAQAIRAMREFVALGNTVQPDEGAAMNLETRNQILDQAERTLATVTGARRQSESNFLQRMLRAVDASISPSGLSPATLIRGILQDKAIMTPVRNVLEVLALPLQRPSLSLRPGDWMLRSAPGTGDVGHIAVLASGDLMTRSMLESEAIDSESSQPGQYGLVIEAGGFPHDRSRPFARRMLDRHGRAPPGTVLLRPRYSATELPADPATGSTETLEEQISVDDVLSEMSGLRCRFLSDYRSTRADGTARHFAADALLYIDDWSGTGIDATIAGFSVPKTWLAPAPEVVRGMRRYDVGLDAQRRAVARNARELTDWVARESEFRTNRRTWETEKVRLETLLARRQRTYSRMWVLQMMYNRFDVCIATWVSHYNTQLTPATPLDPNVVKSMLYQESRMGTSGQHLMPPPSDWSSEDRHPIRSRFNIGQAIDSWGPQQWLMIREMSSAIFTRHGLSAFDRTWFGMSNDDYAAHAPFVRAMREFFEHRDGSNRNLMGTTNRDLHEDYCFWVRTAIRWLFVKYSKLRSATWAEAVRAYNGGGPRARTYRDEVMARVGSTDAFAAEDSVRDDVADADAFAIEHADVQEGAPSLDTSAKLEWEDLTRVNDSRGNPQLFQLVTGVPASVARAGDESKAIFNLRVRNTNSVYNHKNVTTKYRVLDVLPGRQFREVMPWRGFSGPDLEDESSRVIRLSLSSQTLMAAYDPDSPLTRLEVEYHWRETFEDAQDHYNRTGLDFMLVAPIEYLLGRKQRLSPRDIELNDRAQHKDDYWIPITGVNFTEDIRNPVTIQLDVMSSVTGTATQQQTNTTGQSRSTTRGSTISNTFNVQLNGEVSRGGSAKATIDVLELGVQQMFKLGASLGYSRTRTDTSSTTVAREFSRSLMLSRTYATSQAVTTRTTITVSPPEVPQPRGTGGRDEPRVRSVGIGSVGVYLYPLVAFYEVPFVRFDNVNAMGQATRRTEGKVAVPFVTEWRLTSARGG